MNLHQLEALLRQLQACGCASFNSDLQLRLAKAIIYVHRKNIAAHKRHMFFKLRADEQRELLR